MSSSSGDSSLDRDVFAQELARIAALEKRGDWAGLVESLQDVRQWNDQALAASAARAVGRIGDHRATDGLAAASRDTRVEVRRAAVRALGAIQDADAEAALIEALSDPDQVTREWAATALASLGSRASREALSELLEDPSRRMRLGAARSLVALGDRAAIGPLRRAASNESVLGRVYLQTAVLRLRRRRGKRYVSEERAGRLRIRLVATREVPRDTPPPPAMPPLTVLLLDAFTMDPRGGETLDTARDCGDQPHGLALVGEAHLIEAARELVVNGFVRVTETRRGTDGEWQTVEVRSPSTDDESLLRYWYLPTATGTAVLRASKEALDHYYDTEPDDKCS